MLGAAVILADSLLDLTFAVVVEGTGTFPSSHSSETYLFSRTRTSYDDARSLLQEGSALLLVLLPCFVFVISSIMVRCVLSVP